MSKNSVADVKAMLRELGKARRTQARVIQKRRTRAQLRYRAGQVLNVIGYLIVVGGVATLLLSL